MSRSWEYIATTMIERRRDDAALFDRMREIRDRYNGDVMIPLPDVLGAPDMAPLMPQLIYDGVEHTAMRASSTTPVIETPPVGTGNRFLEYASIRRRALYGRWNHCDVHLKMRRWYRQLVAYGTFCAVVLPDDDGAATVQTRDALFAYPEPRDADEYRSPTNCGFIYGRSSDWVARRWPESAKLMAAAPGMWDIVEWVDEDDIVIGALAPREQRRGQEFTGAGMELSRVPNLAGMAPIVIPRRVTLDRIAGQLSQIVPIVDWGSRLMALDVIAAEKMVFPDMVAIGENNQHAVVLGGQWNDGRSGEINFVTGARDIRAFNQVPGPMTNEVVDRLERSARHSGGIPAQYGGELAGSIRSGRTVDAMGAMAIEPRIQELQHVMARSLSELNRSIVAVEKGYGPQRKHSVFSGWAGGDTLCEYVPAKHFETDENIVLYPFPGADLTQITVAVGQLTAAGLMSRQTARSRHPFINDAEVENREVLVEQIDDAVLAGFRNQTAQGAIPLVDAIVVRDQIMAGRSISEAIAYAQRQAQERQAAEAPEPEDEGMAEPPETQPGLAMPGMGVEMQPPPAPVGPPPEGLENLQQLMSAMRTTSRSPV